MEMDKEEFFRRLQALNDSEDSEEDLNETKEILRRSTRPKIPSFSSSPALSQSGRRSQQAPLRATPGKLPGIHRANSAPVALGNLSRESPLIPNPSLNRYNTSIPEISETPDKILDPQQIAPTRETPSVQTKPLLGRHNISNPEIGETPKKVPGIHRTNSAPTSRIQEVKETPPLLRKSSLLRYDISAEDISETPIQKHASSFPSSITKPPQARSEQTPNIGSVVMKNSTGINSMLKKRKRKEVTIKLVPENQRIFSHHTFFYVPPDDIAPIRRTRINRARSYGVTWTKEWTVEITHVVVDKSISYQELTRFLKNSFKLDAIPESIILVNEDYPIDCTQFCSILDPFQLKYAIKGFETPASNSGPSQPLSEESNKPLQIKEAKSRKEDDPPEKQTPPRSQPSTQAEAPIAEPIRSPSPDKAVIDEDKPGLLRKGDELDDMIDVALKLVDVPLSDSEDERPSSRDEAEESGSSDEERSRVQSSKKRRKGGRKGSFKQENFTCMQGGTGVASENNPNQHTIKLLQELGEYYERIRDQWRTKAYRTAVGVLKKQPNKISTYDEAIGLNGIGHRIATKIEEIVMTKRLRRLEYALMDPDDASLQIFLKIYGVGIAQAREWINQGYKTLDDLNSVRLTKNQQLGIEHYDDFNTRIPRDEVTALGDIVKKAVSEIDPQVDALVGGSYRRGAKTSGDIDVLLTKQNEGQQPATT